MSPQNILFTEYKLNDLITLKNRIVMAPMTRVHADDALVPTEKMLSYYARRASAGLIITEGTIIRPDGLGYSHVPGIYTSSQIEGWKKITRAVHQQNGLIFSQIWHVGRVSHPFFLNGELPISSSATTMKNRISRTHDLHYGTSRTLSLEEIKIIINDYATAAKNAMTAGFDGVEIHGANGYLIDQFLHYDTNKRQDDYGNSPENMARFALGVVQACADAIGYERVGLRLSPGAYLNEIKGDMRDGEVFKYLLHQLNQYPMAYIHTGNFEDTTIFPELNKQTMTKFMRSYYKGTLIACGSYTAESAQEGILDNDFDLVAMGRPFIANYDLISRLQKNETLMPYHAEMLETLY